MNVATLARVRKSVRAHGWFKFLGTSGFLTVFFTAYIHLLKNPSGPVFEMPLTVIDRWVGFSPLALPFYLSLWIYVSLPPTLMLHIREVIHFGFWMGALCLCGLAIFYFWPTAVPDANIDWAQYPGMAFLKGVDAAGNACPSLHVATAVFSAICLDRQIRVLVFPWGVRLFSAGWAWAIVYSTMATKQHVAWDVIAGIGLGTVFAYLARWGAPAAQQPQVLEPAN